MTLENTIREKLTAAFNPVKLVIINNSANHDGHASSPKTGNSHFSIEISSPAFKGKSRVESQRMVYQTLSEELRHAIHALALNVSSS